MEQFFDATMRFWADFNAWHPPVLVWYAILSFGAMSAWTLTRFVSAPPMIAGPVCFAVLTFSAMVSNFASRSQVLMGTSELEKTLAYTVLGHAIAAIILLAVFRVTHRSVAK